MTRADLLGQECSTSGLLLFPCAIPLSIGQGGCGSCSISALKLSLFCVVSSSSCVDSLLCSLQIVFRLSVFAVWSSFMCFWEVSTLRSCSAIFFSAALLVGPGTHHCYCCSLPASVPGLVILNSLVN